MILLHKTGIITNFSKSKTKNWKNMIIISHTSGNSKELQQIFIFEWDENYQEISLWDNSIIGSKIEMKTEIIS